MAYQHTQIGTIIFVLVAIIIGIMIVVWLNSDNGYWIIPAATIIFLVVLLTLFGTLTVEINGNTLQCRFGIGLIRKSFSLSDITAVTTVRNPWYYGWGIRLTPKGWMFNVSGLDAVELTFTSGKQFRIGTDQPRRLAAAIQEKIDPPSE
ncbi:hypothetical protein PN462_08000 [Spirulina sp. CS-785/01]|uniref:hypothetical protein n=1 Tax=Spirulina sp. CS-785/01 TaxID=3021716 RepID=UPI00232E67AB|nr:hypothetical protein [Spirulina sp. CS-785/01]MDB9313041.1 hypothetical protein [Spirulina sp. CS-785/01]